MTQPLVAGLPTAAHPIEQLAQQGLACWRKDDAAAFDTGQFEPLQLVERLWVGLMTGRVARRHARHGIAAFELVIESKGKHGECLVAEIIGRGHRVPFRCGSPELRALGAGSGAHATRSVGRHYSLEETTMSSSHYLVAEAAIAGWQFSHKGDITGPFENKEDAIKAAIAAAGKSENPDVEVLVQNADMKIETVWRPEQS